MSDTTEPDPPPEESKPVEEPLRPEHHNTVERQFLLQQAFESERRYGNMCMMIRNATYIQGYVALSGSAYLNSQGDYWLSAGAGIFLCLFTSILFIMHDHFVIYYFDCLKLIKNLEVAANVPSEESYIDIVQEPRHIRVRSKRFGWIRVYGAFFLIGMSGLSLSLASITQAILKQNDGNSSQISEAQNRPQPTAQNAGTDKAITPPPAVIIEELSVPVTVTIDMNDRLPSVSVSSKPKHITVLKSHCST